MLEEAAGEEEGKVVDHDDKDEAEDIEDGLCQDKVKGSLTVKEGEFVSVEEFHRWERHGLFRDVQSYAWVTARTTLRMIEQVTEGVNVEDMDEIRCCVARLTIDRSILEMAPLFELVEVGDDAPKAGQMESPRIYPG